MITLYHVTGTRSVRARWALEELGLDYELRTLNREDGEQQSPTYLAINPIGKVPALTDGAVTLFESGAIVEYLATVYGEQAFMPTPGTPQWANCLKWMYASETISQPLGLYVQHTLRLPEENRVAAIAEQAMQQYLQHLAVLNAELSTKDHLAGATFSAADIMIGYLIGRMAGTGMLDDFEHLKAYHARLSSRPAFKVAFDS